MEDTLYVECSTPLVQELEQDNQTTYNIILIIIVVLVILILAVVILFVIHKCLKRRKRSTER